MGHSLGLSPLWSIPFVLMLGAIALLPLLAHHLWESNRHKLYLSLALSIPVAALYLGRAPQVLAHTAQDYVSFVILLGGLFVVSGGIVLRGDVQATPRNNTIFLAVGAGLASFLGTTGASMLLIRPLLETNQERQRVVHVVIFFIFLVSNIGGCLTPLGDPPLFLGYLSGVPFAWTLRLWPEWLFATLALLGLFYVVDRREYARETPAARGADAKQIRPLSIRGWASIVCLLGIVAAVALLRAPLREIAIGASCVVSYWKTPPADRAANRFSFAPILEVAALFLGIFVTVLPALDLLRSIGPSLGIRTPAAFFWTTGLVSSVLDNAPTYLAFLALGQSLGLEDQVVGVTHDLLRGISLGAVFMGANTYIGNGPNFMVRAIAAERGVRMPSFGGYVVYAALFLAPLYAATALLFF